MGVHVIKMPDIGEGIAEVELVMWYVKVGDTVTEDMILADVMTEKATIEIPSPVHGKVLALGGAAGQVMAVGSDLIQIEIEGAGNVRPGAALASAPVVVTPSMPAPATVAAAPAPVPVPQKVEPAAPARIGIPVRGCSQGRHGSARVHSCSAARPG